MPLEPTPLVAAIEELLRRRGELQAEIGEIDAQLEQVAALIGSLGAKENAPALGAEEPKIDRRRQGSLVEFVIEQLRGVEAGLSRGDLKALVGRHSEFGPKLKANENVFYNTVGRLLRRREIVDVGGILYEPKLAPSASDSQGLFGHRPNLATQEAF